MCLGLAPGTTPFAMFDEQLDLFDRERELIDIGCITLSEIAHFHRAVRPKFSANMTRVKVILFDAPCSPGQNSNVTVAVCLWELIKLYMATSI